jgi:hypothetical protein
MTVVMLARQKTAVREQRDIVGLPMVETKNDGEQLSFETRDDNQGGSTD